MSELLKDKATEWVKRGRLRVLLRPYDSACAAFFGTLLLGLEPIADESVGTMATDGKRLLFAPEYVLGKLADERHLKAVLVHEVLHCSLFHFDRERERDHALWNIACDLSLNPLVKENEQAGDWLLPDHALMPGKGMFKDLPPGLCAEDYYARIVSDGSFAKMVAGACGEAGGMGKVASQGSADPCEATQEWKGKVAIAAAKVSGRGDVPGSVRRLIDGALKPKAPWRRVLAEFVERCRDEDSSWSRPDRRFVARGILLPGSDGERIGPIAVCVDASGSITDRQLEAFSSEIRGIAEATGSSLRVLVHDTATRSVTAWEPGDPPFSMRCEGGGGTSHIPVLADAERLSEESDRPFCAIVCLTDMHSLFPSRPPSVPVLWCVYGNGSPSVPFGRVAFVEG